MVRIWQSKRAVCCFTLGFHLLVLSLPSEAAGSSLILAQRGDAVPNAGTLGTMFAPLLNNAGQVAFEASITSGIMFDNGIYRASAGGLVEIARRGNSAPDYFVPPFSTSNGQFESLAQPVINDSGTVAFYSTISNTSSGYNLEGIFRGDGFSTSFVIRTPHASPRTGEHFFELGYSPALNANGRTAFTGYSTDEGIFIDPYRSGVYTSIGGSIFNSAVTTIAEGDINAPDGTGGLIHFFGAPSINSSGDTAFLGYYRDRSYFDTTANKVVFRGNGTSLVEIARPGKVTPDGLNSISYIYDQTIPINDASQVAFVASLNIPGLQAIYRSSGGALTQIARTGLPSPFSFFRITSLDYSEGIALNDSGQVAFIAQRESIFGTDFGPAIYLSNGGGLHQIVSQGDPAPDGNGFFAAFQVPALNEQNQVAFFAWLSDTAGGQADNYGIFVSNGSEITQVVRRGDELAGTTITGLEFSPSTGANGHERSGFNDLGQVAFSAYLANGSQVIGLFTPGNFAPGDFDEDGMVDGRDFLTWQRNGAVGNLADWKANYGAPLDAIAMAVPEPTGCLPLLTGLIWLLSLQRKPCLRYPR